MAAAVESITFKPFASISESKLIILDCIWILVGVFIINAVDHCSLEEDIGLYLGGSEEQQLYR